MSEIFLPINSEECLKSYTHNAYNTSIIFSDAVAGERVVKYEILGKKGDAQIINNVCDTHKEGEFYEVTCPRIMEVGGSYVYFECEENEEFILHVVGKRRNCSWERVDICIDDKIFDNKFDFDDCLVKFGCPSNEKLFVRRRNDFIYHFTSKKILADDFYLKVVKEKLKLTFLYSLNGQKWTEVGKDNLPAVVNYKKLAIGVITETRNNFANWYACNYIQTTLSTPYNGQRMYDYFSMAKYYRPFFTNHFLDCLIEYHDFNELSTSKLAKLVESRLKEKFYINIESDHYYIPGTGSYGLIEYFHEILIYGINTKKKKIYALGYNDVTDVFKFELSFNDFYKSIRTNEVQMILLRVAPDYINFRPNTEIIKRRLKDYLEGKDTSMELAELVPPLGGSVVAYGIKCLDFFLDNESDLFAFCRETRMSYFVYEHEMLMNDRVQYLIKNNHFQSY